MKIFKKNKLFSRKHSNIFSTLQNKIINLKKENLKNVWETYYIPKAISAVLKEQNYLTTPGAVSERAKAMLDADMAKGVLDKLYRFRNNKKVQNG